MLTVHVNPKRGTLGFSVNGLFKGVAFKSETIEYDEMYLTIEMNTIG